MPIEEEILKEGFWLEEKKDLSGMWEYGKNSNRKMKTEYNACWKGGSYAYNWTRD